MEENTIRLNKVLREFNISLDRAVEFLNSQGHEIEARPTTKISREIYEVLTHEFQIDKSKKAEAKEVRKEKIKEKDSLRLERENELEAKRILEKKMEVLRGKTNPGGPIQVGKIDLDSFSSKIPDKEGLRKLTKREIDLNEENSFDFAITNFRKANEKWKFELAPVTLLTGTNNSGKSSVLKALLLLEDYANSDNPFEINFNGQNYKKHKIDCFSNALNWNGIKQDNPYLKFEFKRFGLFVQLIFGPESISSEKIKKGFLYKLRIRRLSDDSEFTINRISEGQYEFYLEDDILSIKDEHSSYYTLLQNMGMKTFFENRIKQLEAERVKLNASDPASIALKQDLNQNKSRLKQVESQIKKLESDRKNKLVFHSHFSLGDFSSDELRLDSIIKNVLLRYIDNNQKLMGSYDEKSELEKILHFGKRVVNTLKWNLFHLSPQRNSQTRLYVNDNTSTDIYELINWHSQHPLIEEYDPYVFIQDWMEKFRIGEDFRIKDIEGLASVIEIKEDGEWRNIVDKGFGVGQLFSIIFRIGLCINNLNSKTGHRSNTFEDQKPLILIEEPETNLHPKLQSLLADLFYESHGEYGIQFIVETHSEYIIRNSQLIVNEATGASKNRVPEDEYYELPYVVYYFDDKNGPYNMEFRNDGIFKKDFGIGFFDEASKKSLQLLKASRRNG